MEGKIKHQMDTMQRLSVIEVSVADRHSHILMVKKPHTDRPKYRLCMDFVNVAKLSTRSVEP
jgi:hypothetical protein